MWQQHQTEQDLECLWATPCVQTPARLPSSVWVEARWDVGCGPKLCQVLGLSRSGQACATARAPHLPRQRLRWCRSRHRSTRTAWMFGRAWRSDVVTSQNKPRQCDGIWGVLSDLGLELELKASSGIVSRFTHAAFAFGTDARAASQLQPCLAKLEFRTVNRSQDRKLQNTGKIGNLPKGE